jgi:hypothetical protein
MDEACFKKPGKTWLEALAEAEMTQARSDVSARRNLLDRLCGKPVESVEMTGTDGTPLQTFTFVMPDGTRKTARELAEGPHL